MNSAISTKLFSLMMDDGEKQIDTQVLILWIFQTDSEYIIDKKSIHTNVSIFYK